MHRQRSRSIVAVTAFALLAGLQGIAASPASAVPTPSGCKASTIAGATISWFPAQAPSHSTLKVACRFDAATGSSMASAKFSVHDAAVAQYHNGAARTITNTAIIASGATTFTATNFAATGAFVNRPITGVGTAGAGIPARTFVKSISGAGLVTLSNPTTASIAAGTSFKIDNTIGRSRTDVATTAASTTVTSATANFTAADVGLSVGGTNIDPYTTIATVVNATTITLSAVANATGVAQTVTFGGTLLNSTTRTATNSSITSATVINSTAMKWKTDDIGLPVYGPGIPANTFIVSFIGANATTTGGMTVNAGPISITAGDPSATAPTNADTVASQGVQLDLNPSLVAGGDACTNDTPEGFGIIARWNNPGSFQGAGLTNTQPATTKAIGQLFFDTSAADFSGFVVERGALSAGDPNGSVHYDVVFPFVPTNLALCASATSPGLAYSLTVLPTTLSVATLPGGTGKPGSAQFRNILPTPTGGYTDSVTVQSDDPLITFAPASEFTRLCIYPAGPATVSFQCGN